MVKHLTVFVVPGDGGRGGRERTRILVFSFFFFFFFSVLAKIVWWVLIFCLQVFLPSTISVLCPLQVDVHALHHSRSNHCEWHGPYAKYVCARAVMERIAASVQLLVTKYDNKKLKKITGQWELWKKKCSVKTVFFWARVLRAYTAKNLFGFLLSCSLKPNLGRRGGRAK